MRYFYYIRVNCKNVTLIINYVNHVINYVSVHNALHESIWTFADNFNKCVMCVQNCFKSLHDHLLIIFIETIYFVKICEYINTRYLRGPRLLFTLYIIFFLLAA